MDFQRIAVIGPGLLGGSLVRGICRRGADTSGMEVRVWGRREEPLEQLRAEGGASLASTSLEKVAEGADLLILATPIGVMEPCIRQLVESETLRQGMTVTDVGSVKACVVNVLEPMVVKTGATFVGSHPMAGSEKTGLEHASADLFEGAACLITPTSASDPAAVDRVDAFWQWLGARTTRMSPDEHDRAVAMISHVPHLVAALLVESVLGQLPGLADFAGGGFRDSTRIAAGAPEMWTEILLENREAVREALSEFHRLTGESLAFFDEMKKEDLRQLLTDAKSRRDRLSQKGGTHPVPS